MVLGTVRRRRCRLRLRRLRLRRLRRKLFTFSTSSQNPLHRSLLNFAQVYPRGRSIKFVQIGAPPLFFEELWVILCKFQSLLKKSSSPKPLAIEHSNLVFKVPRGSSY